MSQLAGGQREGTSVERLVQAYIDIVSRLDQTCVALTDTSDGGLGIWTVIDAEPFGDAPRDQIHAAERESSRMAPHAPVVFCLVNRREYGDEAIAWAVPQQARRAWGRPPQA